MYVRVHANRWFMGRVICAYHAPKKCKGLAYENRITINRFIQNPDSPYSCMVSPEKTFRRAPAFL